MSIKICIKYKLQTHNKSLNFYKIYILIKNLCYVLCQIICFENYLRDTKINIV